MEIISIRHSYPEKAGFIIDRPVGREDYTFLHFYQSVEIVTNDKTVRTAPHACILFKPHTPQYFRCETDLIHDWFHFSDLSESEKDALFIKEIPTDTILYPVQYEFITRIVFEMEKEYFLPLERSADMMRLKFQELFVLLKRQLQNNDLYIDSDTVRRFRSFRTELMLNPSEHWTIENMSKQIGYSQSYFFALYKHIFGVSPIKDLIFCKMDKAKKMLSFSDLTVTEIAYRLGYGNVTHFLRQFKQETGVTPLGFRIGQRTGKSFSPDNAE